MDKSLGDRLLKQLPVDGTPKTNKWLREQLHVQSDEYWPARDALLEDGRVIRLRGRGGRTARVVDAPDEVPLPWSKTVKAIFAGSGALAICSTAYWIFGEGAAHRWDAMGLLFGAVTVFAVGLSVLIYSLQEAAAVVAANRNANEGENLRAVLSNVHRVLNAVHSDLQDVMKPAVDADADAPEPETDSIPIVGDEPEDDDTSEGISTDERGSYFPPEQIPLKAIHDVVQAWSAEDKDGRWTVESLLGGFRPFNKNGNHQGTAWILAFRSLKGEVRRFRVTVTGRKNADGVNSPKVSELGDGDGAWRALTN